MHKRAGEPEAKMNPDDPWCSETAIDRDAPTACEPRRSSALSRYASEPFPCPLDLAVLREVLRFSHADESERASACDAPLSAARVETLLRFAERMAEVGARKREARLVQAGLIALVIAGNRSGLRQVWRALALLHASAAEFLPRPQLLFEQTAMLAASSEIAPLLEGFICRGSDGRVIR